jgi:phosphoribosylformimino-5-aminoimidazole carboxamide ribonucleotide (ProFAR) isomerase
MILYPAIDILEGNAVRLVKGDYSAKTVYDEDPVAAARGWAQDGARFLHPSSSAGGCARCPRCATRCAPAPSA